jgi:hypothetical protein
MNGPSFLRLLQFMAGMWSSIKPKKMPNQRAISHQSPRKLYHSYAPPPKSPIRHSSFINIWLIQETDQLLGQKIMRATLFSMPGALVENLIFLRLYFAPPRKT